MVFSEDNDQQKNTSFLSRFSELSDSGDSIHEGISDDDLDALLSGDIVSPGEVARQQAAQDGNKNHLISKLFDADEAQQADDLELLMSEDALELTDTADDEVELLLPADERQMSTAPESIHSPTTNSDQANTADRAPAANSMPSVSALASSTLVGKTSEDSVLTGGIDTKDTLKKDTLKDGVLDTLTMPAQESAKSITPAQEKPDPQHTAAEKPDVSPTSHKAQNQIQNQPDSAGLPALGPAKGGDGQTAKSATHATKSGMPSDTTATTTNDTKPAAKHSTNNTDQPVNNQPTKNKRMSTMTTNQQTQIEKILTDIDELKRKLHGMNSDFYNAATDSAVLISEVRELEALSANDQDFSATYNQSRDLRRTLVEARKSFNTLASAIDELEEALESDLYAVQKS